LQIGFLHSNDVFVYNSEKEVGQMRLLFRAAIVLIICLAAAALPAAPVQAQAEHITLHPGSGYVGEDVYVTGTNFTDDNYWVYYESDDGWVEVLDRYDCEVDSHGFFSTEDFLIPESCKGDHEIRVSNSHSSSSSYRVAYAHFTVEPKIEIVSPSTAEGPVGTNVTVKGLGFAQNEENVELRYDDEVIEDDIPVDEDGSWEWTFHIPPSSRGNHKIDAEGDESEDYEVEDATFEVTPAIDILDEPSGSIVVEPSGSPDESITMTGSGFYAEDRYIKILFAGEEAETEPEIIRADEDGYWEAIFKVPAMPADEYSVTAEGEYTEDVTALTFEIKPGLTLSPDEGHVGTDLTVTGHGFAPGKNVLIRYDGRHQETATSNTNGSFEVSFPVPDSEHGARQVTAEVDGIVEGITTFTMESDAPDTPDLISPDDGDRVGLIGKARPAFEWTDVEDVSGVYYNLQIATSANVTNAGFIETVRSLEGLRATNYTLNATEALPYGTYYWIVQAVDGAENESGWTEARSFRAGLLPLWAFIVIIVAIVAGIGAAVYFFVIRRRIYYL
jgi:hypothetical protein